jgi:cell fate (sporulation/competence/biofilm development) regulator YlbF (YheA/YmcA/DUF963 family)
MAKISKKDKEYLLEWDRKLAREELKYARKLKKEINRAIDSVKPEVTNYASAEQALRDEHEANLNFLAFQSAQTTTQTFVNFQSNALNYTVQDSLYEAVYNQYATTQILELSKLKADTTFKQIQNKIIETLQNGSISEKDIAKEILKIKKLTPARALMIARTEVHNTASFAQHEVVREFESQLGETMYKKWMPTFDKRTRKDHAAMIKHPPIPLNQLFNIGLLGMDRPGDPRGGASQVINCRCALIYAKLEDI